MYRELLPKKNSKQLELKRNRSKKTIPFQHSSPPHYVGHQRSISPWEYQEHANKNEVITHEQKMWSIENKNVQKRSLELKKPHSIQNYDRSQQLKNSIMISKDFLLLLKKHKHKGLMQNRLGYPYKLKKVAKIQMNLGQDKLHQSDLSNKKDQGTPKNPQQKHSKQILKDWPTRVKIQKKFIQTHRKKLSFDEFLHTQRDYSEAQFFTHQSQLRSNSKNTNKDKKLRKQKSKSKNSSGQKKFTIKDFNTLAPLMCKGDIVSHQPSKASRKFKFRNELAIQLRKFDPETFLYKI